MITLNKETKIKLLKCIKTGIFDGEQFPELASELKRIEIEVIDKSSDVDRTLYPKGQTRNDLLL